MLRPFYNISIQQSTPYFKDSKETKRDSLLEFNFAVDYKTCSTWENHTDTCEIDFPKNVILKTGDTLFRQSGTYNVILGSGSDVIDAKNNVLTAPPLLMRGDLIYIEDGYWFKNELKKDIQVGTTRFAGYISKVESSIPIKIECEDNFYLLKRTPVNKSLWKGNLIELCQYMINEVNTLFSGNAAYIGKNGNPYPTLTVNDVVDSDTRNFSLGYLEIGDITCAELLSKMRTQFGIESFFRGNVLFFGFPIYDKRVTEDKAVFEFQNNIFPDHNLEYKNKSDVILSAVVSCKTINPTGKKTKDGLDATKWEKDSVLVYWDLPSSTFKGIVKSKGNNFPENTGERHKFIYPIDPNEGKPSTQKLIDYGIEHLKKYYYNGFSGSFKTLGYPFVKWGDDIYLIDRVLADRNGLYKVKKVETTGGSDSITQEIFLDYKIENKLPTEFQETFML